MDFPDGLKFTKEHEWLRETDNKKAFIGITDFAQAELGDIVYVNLPEAGDKLTAGEPLGDVESVKAVSGVHSPVTAVVKAINEELLDNPALINTAPYDAWLVEVENITGYVDLMDTQTYRQFCEQKKG